MIKPPQDIKTSIIVIQFLTLVVVVFVVGMVLDDRSKWMDDLKVYQEAKTADRVTHTAVQEALSAFAAKNGLIPVDIEKPDLPMEFPKPPVPIWRRK